MRGTLIAPLLAMALVAIAAGTALGFVPSAERIAKATVGRNEASSRTEALQLELTLRVAEREPIGVGKLVSHPTGLARLELRDAAGRVERHLRLINEHTASRDGRRVDEPREFLPPLSLLQVDSPDLLQEAFSQFGLDVEAAALAPCGDRICYVLGDRARVAPPLPPTEAELAARSRIEAAGRPDGWEALPDALETPPQEAPEPEAEGDDSQGLLAFMTGDDDDADGRPSGPSIWVDSRSFEIVRMEDPSGLVVRFGPVVDFEGVRFPDSITIEEPGYDAVRFDILNVTPVNAAARGFNYDWLLAPAESESPAQVAP